ncbi:ABC transporter permease [Pseudoflavonifractor sp. MSJ-30]|uniref:ABC transporter permease n=1 Tax=Pseudoflavonifractor sp. MSJ-30 TaxID=2841525 RepID=UPI001C1090B8|nr:ABC transporter permease [Pseudoflavonifractor sp. MSJ-30]MBU5453381.1 ABC transporter permease [Pseudoflavonifractor sp. MSJ-30]
MLENIHLAFEGIWSHKLRSILTMLGIIIGIAAIITIVSTIKGTNEQIKENLIGAGNNVVTVSLNQNGNEYDLSWNPLPDTVRVISEETRQELENISGAEEVSLYYSRSYTDGFFYLDTAFNGNVLGVDRHYFSAYGMQIRSGRGFTGKDYTEFRKVALVDSTAAKSLFSGVDPVGKEIEFGSDVYTVVGVIGPAEEFTPTINSLNDYYLYANDGSGSIYFPDSIWPALYQFDEPQCVAIKVKNTDVMASVGKKAADLLTEKQIIGTDTGFDYRSADMLEQAQQLQNMSKSTNTQLVWIASISLLVGGIGVMNIMLVSVTERTSEIGLKKALGAKKKRILLQFLTEAAVLTSIGGIIGVLTGIGLAELISGLMQIPVAISAPAIIIAVVFSTLIGVIFGLLPATKAANLNPIDALRRV